MIATTFFYFYWLIYDLQDTKKVPTIEELQVKDPNWDQSPECGGAERQKTPEFESHGDDFSVNLDEGFTPPPRLPPSNKTAATIPVPLATRQKNPEFESHGDDFFVNLDEGFSPPTHLPTDNETAAILAPLMTRDERTRTSQATLPQKQSGKPPFSKDHDSGGAAGPSGGFSTLLVTKQRSNKRKEGSGRGPFPRRV